MKKSHLLGIVCACVISISHHTIAKAYSFIPLGDLPGGAFFSAATGVSADGSTIIGISESASGTEAFRWTSGSGMVGLGDLSGGVFSSEALGVSGDGSTIVGSGSSASGDEAFRWTSGSGMVGLGDLSGGIFSSLARDVSGDGSVIVGTSESASGTEAFRWTSGSGMVGLGDLPGGDFLSRAYGVSADGSVIVGDSYSSIAPEAFLWDASNGMQTIQHLLEGAGIDLTGWVLLAALGISSDGTTIVGAGNNNGTVEAWAANISPVPPPPALWLFGSGLLGLIGIARRKKVS